MAKISKGFDRTQHKKGFSAYFVSVDGRKRYFANAELQNKEYERRVALQSLGVGYARPPDARDTIELDEMRRLAGEREETLLEIFRVGVQRIPTRRMLAADARDLFVAEKLRSVEAGELKRISYNQQRQAANIMVSGPFKYLSDLRNPQFEAWLRGRGLSPKGLHTFACGLGVFLNFCVRKKFLVENPLDEIEIPDPPAKRTIWKLEKVEEMFRKAESDFPDLVPLLAVEWFAGVRPHTAELLDYSDFDRKEKVIQLRVGKFAQGDTQFVERFPDTLWHWLPRKRKGAIAPPRVRLRMREFRRAMGYSRSHPWPKDVARHTFVSHFAALTGSLDRVAFTVNHHGPSTTLRWYRKRVPRPRGRRYFALRPRRK